MYAAADVGIRVEIEVEVSFRDLADCAVLERTGRIKKEPGFISVQIFSTRDLGGSLQVKILSPLSLLSLLCGLPIGLLATTLGPGTRLPKIYVDQKTTKKRKQDHDPLDPY